MARLCPICDAQIKGSFCKDCKRFVKPVVFKSDIHLNTRHDAYDFDCEYHGTTADQDRLYHGTDADLCDDGNTTYRKTIEKQKNTALQKAVIAVVIGIAALPYFVAVIIILLQNIFEFSTTNTGSTTPESAIVESSKQAEIERQGSIDNLCEENRNKYKLGDSDFRYVTEQEIRDEELISNTPPLMETDIDMLSDIVKSVVLEYSYLGFDIDDGMNLDFNDDHWIALQLDGSILIECLKCKDYMVLDKNGGMLAFISLYYDVYSEKISRIEINDYDEDEMSTDILSEICTKIMNELGVKLSTGDFVYEENYSAIVEGYLIQASHYDNNYYVAISKENC